MAPASASRTQTHRLFFAAAAIQAALSVVIWAFAPPDTATPAGWHAHELLFGYASAVIAGFLFAKTSRPVVLLVLLLWAAARVAWIFPVSPAVAAGLSVSATAAISGISARGFLRGAKQVRNFVFPLLLGLLLCCDLLSQMHVFGMAEGMERAAILLAIYIVVALILVMGGRIAGAAFSGLNQRAGGARIAPRLGLERILPFLVGGVAVAAAADGFPALLAICAWLAAGVICLRMLDWLPALRLAGPDLWGLAAAQVFIAAGLTGIGLQPFGPGWSATAPLHLLTIGGIGIATVTMMLKTTAQRERQEPGRRLMTTAVLLLGFAAVVRAMAEGVGPTAYAIAAIAWCAAMLCCLARMLRR
ncbi:NnrS family protein [Ferrovibrio sp.]|uniref:NnrS family protein n=1 Tax=Ferrovibrio sp. TaxID=1917215 RepID=UPI000CC4D7AC|nr:NnrS family protein [Ferrovibrio sp.]PJI39650.1 MAG: hypothetical protein CTR53_12590 [Ferrovibrio sp.]